MGGTSEFLREHQPMIKTWGAVPGNKEAAETQKIANSPGGGR